MSAHAVENAETCGTGFQPVAPPTATLPEEAPYVDAHGLCESDSVGARTRIWAFAHVMRGAVVGADCNVCGHVFIESGAVVGDRVTIKNGALVWDGVVIEDDAFIGPGVIFTNDLYPRSRRGRSADGAGHTKERRVETIVRRGATVGAGAVIVCGNSIGRHAMVAAGAVVTHPVAGHRLVAGNPARDVGWVCLCGHTLDDGLTCPQCSHRYREVAGALGSVGS